MNDFAKLARRHAQGLAENAESQAQQAVNWAGDVSELMLEVASRGQIRRAGSIESRENEYTQGLTDTVIFYNTEMHDIGTPDMSCEIKNITVLVSTLYGDLVADLDPDDLPYEIEKAIAYEHLTAWRDMESTYASHMSTN